MAHRGFPIRPHTKLVTAGDAQRAFPVCKVCGGRYNKSNYYEHTKTIRHIKALYR